MHEGKESEGNVVALFPANDCSSRTGIGFRHIRGIRGVQTSKKESLI